jgi:hypothetical protein
MNALWACSTSPASRQDSGDGGQQLRLDEAASLKRRAIHGRLLLKGAEK